MALERISWIANGSKFKRVEGNIQNIDKIPRGVYSVDFNPLEGWSLIKTSEEFTFSFKIYDLQSEFVNRVLTAYHNTKGNLGVLLSGIRGTGKTIIAKIIANKLNLPIIVVKSMGADNTPLIEYLASFNFDCVLFFDEFEKNFKAKDSSILQIMDGVYSQDSTRKVFLLTVNETRVNENLLSRPSRIRYVKHFDNISEEMIRAYLMDNLIDMSCADDVVAYMDSLTISTIDILKTVVEEVNIFGFDKFIETNKIFNVDKANYQYWTKFETFGDNVPSIKDFLRDIKKLETLSYPSRYDYTNEEEYEKALTKYRREKPDINPNSRMVESKKSFKNLKPGDQFGYWPEDGETISEIDQESGVIKTIRCGGGYTQLYYIKDRNTKPSLFSGLNNFVFGYGRSQSIDYDDESDFERGDDSEA